MANRTRGFTGMESLENRRLLACDFFNAAGDAEINFDEDTGVLEICGNHGNDDVTVTFENDEVEVRLEYDDLDDLGDRDTETQDEKIDDVSSIVFRGFNGNDDMEVNVDELNNGVTINHIRLEFSGDDGNDTFENNTALRSTASGGEDMDTLIGGTYYDIFDGGAGNDTLLGNAGNDTLQGDQGNDILDGGEGHDKYVFSGANLGSDTVEEVAGQGTDTFDLRGLELTNNSQYDTTFVDLSATYQQWVYYAYNGEHFKLTLSDGEAIEKIYGTDVADYMYGNGQVNRLYGYDGNDVLLGRGGNDFLYGHADNDYLRGDQGSDRLYGSSGDDVMFGDEYNSDVSIAWWQTQSDDGLDLDEYISKLRERTGDTGNLDGFLADIESNEDPNEFGSRDYIYGSYGNDVAYGGSGNDYIRGEQDDDVLLGGLGNDDLYGDSTYERSTDGHDQVFGGSGVDDLFGMGGDDVLMGGDGADNLQGGTDNDFLVGGLDDDVDTLTGGDGADGFMRYYEPGYVTIRGYTFYTWVSAETENETDYDSSEGDWIAYYYV